LAFLKVPLYKGFALVCRVTSCPFLKGKAIPLQARTCPEVSRRLRLTDFKTIGM
jgi:hypothetical protein